MKHQGFKTGGRERFQPDPQGEKNLLENVPSGEVISKRRVFFRWEKIKNIKTTAGWATKFMFWPQDWPYGKKESVD